MTPRWRRTDAKASAALAALSQLRRAVESLMGAGDARVISMKDTEAARRRRWPAPALIPAILVFLREHAREAAQVSSAAAFTALAVTPALAQAHAPAHHHVIRREARTASRRQHYGLPGGSDRSAPHRKRGRRALGSGHPVVPPPQPAPDMSPGPVILPPPLPAPLPPLPPVLRGPVRDIRAAAGTAAEILGRVLAHVPSLLERLAPAPAAGAHASVGGLIGGIGHAVGDGTARARPVPGQHAPRLTSPSPSPRQHGPASPSPGAPAPPSPSPAPSCLIGLLGLCIP